QTLNPKLLPTPAGDQQVTAAVEGTPSGTRFSIPARMSFPVGAQLKPGTQLPILILNSAGTQFDTSEFTAVVDETGRTAWADITHFTTFALGVPNDEFLTIEAVTPSSGLPGATINVNGSGFSDDLAGNQVTFTTSSGTGLAQVVAASATSLTVVVPGDAVTGTITVRALEQTSVTIPFTVPVPPPLPVITALTPATMVSGPASMDIQITGTGFDVNSYVTYDASRLNTNFIDSNTLAITVSGQKIDPSVHQIKVVNSGAASNAADFTVQFPAPSISELKPGNGFAGQPVDVTIVGVGFTRSSKVRVNGSEKATTFVDSMSLMVNLTSASAATQQITVQNPTPGGGPSIAATFSF